MSAFYIPALSPIRFHQYGVGDFAYNEIPYFEYQRGYCQKYTHGDRPYIQVVSDTYSANIVMQLVDNSGTVFKSWGVGQSYRSYRGLCVYHWIGYFPLSSVAPVGVYFLKMTIEDLNGQTVLYSEPIYLTDDTSKLVTISYTHDENDFDRVFVGNNVVPSILRIEGGMKSEGLQPGGKFTMFQDQDYNSVVLQSQPYNVEKWTFGPSEGVPNHIADLINRIFGLSNVTIDGVQYSRNEGSKLERTGETEYPLAGWSLDLIKSLNPYSAEFATSAAAFTADNTSITADSNLQTADQTEL